MKWRIWYGDGSDYSDRQGSPFEAPRVDVQVIAQFNEQVGYEVISGGDYFYWEPERGGWRTTSGFGLYDHLIRCKQPLILFGRHMTDAEWTRLFLKVKAELGDKQAWLQGERRP
jgi:hypothetical protein